jgi:flagellar motility protein MotE (MotC chaperone)
LVYSSQSALSQNEKNRDEINKENDINKIVEQRLNKILKKISTKKITEFSKSLLEKEKEIEKEKKKIELRNIELSKMENEVTKKIEEISKRQSKIIGCLDKNQKKREKRVDHLVQIVSGMKPQTAADMLAVQESGLTVEIISKLDPTRISKIFNLMDKEISARLQKEYLNMQQ